MDGYDFQSVSLSLSRLSDFYNEPRDKISMSITLTLLFRPIGAIVFGLAGDLYGRKWPMIVNLVVIGILELATAYCKTFASFLAVCMPPSRDHGCELQLILWFPGEGVVWYWNGWSLGECRIYGS